MGADNHSNLPPIVADSKQAALVLDGSLEASTRLNNLSATGARLRILESFRKQQILFSGEVTKKAEKMKNKRDVLLHDRLLAIL